MWPEHLVLISVPNRIWRKPDLLWALSCTKLSNVTNSKQAPNYVQTFIHNNTIFFFLIDAHWKMGAQETKTRDDRELKNRLHKLTGFIDVLVTETVVFAYFLPNVGRMMVKYTKNLYNNFDESQNWCEGSTKHMLVRSVSFPQFFYILTAKRCRYTTEDSFFLWF